MIWHCTSVKLSNSRPSNPNNGLHSEPPLRCSDAYPRDLGANPPASQWVCPPARFKSIKFSLQNISFFRISKAPHPSHSKDKSGPIVGPWHCSLPPSCGAALTAQRKILVQNHGCSRTFFTAFQSICPFELSHRFPAAERNPHWNQLGLLTQTRPVLPHTQYLSHENKHFSG